MGAKLTALSYLGLAVEATLGTPVASTGFIPVLSFKPQDNPKYVADQGRRGLPFDMFGQYLSVNSSEYEIDGDFYPTSGGNLLAGIFGQDAVTGTSSPYTHAFSTVMTPPSYTLGDYYVAGYRQFPGSRVTKLDLKFTPDAGLTYSASLLGFASTTATAPGTQTFGTNPYFLGWEAALTLAGSSNNRLRSFGLTLQRAKSEVLFSAANSQNPYDIFLGPLEATWSLSFYMQDDTEYALALTQATKDVKVVITQPGTNYSLTFESSAVQFTKPTIDRSGEYVLVSLSGTAVYNATDSSIVKATLVNGLSTAYSTTAAS